MGINEFLYSNYRFNSKLMKFKIPYWIFTVGMCGMFLFSAQMYFRNYEMVTGYFENHMGFPGWMVYPLAVAKILGVIAVVSNLSRMLKEWAYAGFFFDGVMAFTAHYMVGDGIAPMALFAIVMTIGSRIMWELVERQKRIEALV